jgi:formimidoylglutamate deiminase
MLTNEAVKPHTIEADWVWTGSSFEKDVQITVDQHGKISNIKHKSGASSSEDSSVMRLKNCALLPGMVNSHSHAFQRGLRGKGEKYPKQSEGQNFWTWREEMYKLVGKMDRTLFYDLSKQAFSEMLKAGITTVGEFHYLHHDKPESNAIPFDYDQLILKAAKDAGIRIVLLETYYAQGGFGQPLGEAQQRFRPEVLLVRNFVSNNL